MLWIIGIGLAVVGVVVLVMILERWWVEVTLLRHYIDDEAISDENEDAYLHYARNAFGYPKYALHVLEQSLRIFMQYQELQKEK